METVDETAVPTNTIIEGREIVLSNGAKVWGGIYNGSTVWRFTSKAGAVTRLVLSQEAAAAFVQLFQGILGCDPDFASIVFETPKESSPDSALEKP